MNEQASQTPEVSTVAAAEVREALADLNIHCEITPTPGGVFLSFTSSESYTFVDRLKALTKPRPPVAGQLSLF
jgi:hypothetical protein